MKKFLLLFILFSTSANIFAEDKENDGKYDCFCVLNIRYKEVRIDCPWVKDPKAQMHELDLGEEIVTTSSVITYMSKHGWEFVSILSSEGIFINTFLMKKRVVNEEDAKDGIVLKNYNKKN